MENLLFKVNQRISYRIRDLSIARVPLVQLVKVLLYFDKPFSEELNQASLDYERVFGIDSFAVRNDMITQYCVNWITPKEYLRFAFFDKAQDERLQYMVDYETVTLFRYSGRNTLPSGKYERFNQFRKYFNRDVLYIAFDSSADEEQRYQDFITKHTKYILKPVWGTKGHGIKMMDSIDCQTLASLKAQVMGPCLLEEVINQGEELKRFNPSSVNTIRFVSGMSTNGQYVPLFSLLRIGRDGSIVDNVGSGGLVCLVDLNSGTIISDAYCGIDRFERHPDTGVRFMDSIIPEWPTLRSLVSEIHSCFSNQFVFGFDYAWSTQGWDLIEVNPAPSLDSYQAIVGRGIRRMIEESLSVTTNPDSSERFVRMQ